MLQSKQFQKQMEEQKLANSDLEKQVMVAFDELEENKNSKIELENKLKDCEVLLVLIPCFKLAKTSKYLLMQAFNSIIPATFRNVLTKKKKLKKD